MFATITLKNERLVVRSRYSPILVERFNTIPGRQFHKEDKTWSFPCVRDVLLMVCDAAGILPEMLAPEIKQLIGRDGLLWARPAPPPDLSVLEGHPWKTMPYDHQIVNLARLMIEPRWLLADEQGTGKTFTLANRIFRLLVANMNYRVLILCPKSVVEVWKDELMKHAGLEADVIEGTVQAQKYRLNGCRQIKISNYEKLLHAGDTYIRASFDAVIFDEAHRLKNITTATWKMGRAISERAQFCWGLSGTPVTNGLEDWLGVLEAIKPGHLPVQGARGQPTKAAFEARYVYRRRLDQGGPLVIAGYRNVPELHGYVSAMTSRVTKAECLDLPEKVYSRREVVLYGHQKEVYDSLRKDAVAVLKDQKKQGTLTIRNILTQSLRLLQVVGGFVPDDGGTVYDLEHKAKWPALVEILDEVGDRPVVIWCRFLPEVRWLCEKLKKFGEVCSITGASTPEERKVAMRGFQRGDSRFFVGTSAGGEGITLTASDVEIFWSRDYNLKNYLQQQDRCILEGQKILTPSGWKAVESIRAGDRVIDRTGRSAQVTDAWSKECTKLIAEILVEGWPEKISVTEDHRFLLSSGEWKEAGRLRPGDRLAMPVEHEEEGSLVSLPFDADCRVDDRFLDHWGHEREKPSLRKAPDNVLFDADSLFVMGFYAGDGFSSVLKGKGAFISFCGNQTNKKKCLERCSEWFKRFGVSTSFYEAKKDLGLELRCFSSEWARWFLKHFGHGALHKRLPEFLLGLNKNQSRSLLEGLIASDGYIRKDRHEYSTMSENLAANVALVMLNAGHRPCITNGSTGQTIVAFSNTGLSQDSLVRAVNLRFTKKPKGRREKVYDLTVENSESFVVGLSVAHNCHRIGQKNTVSVIKLIARGTIDERVDEKLEAKTDMMEMLLQKPEDYL